MYDHFRTTFAPKPLPTKLSLQDRFFLIGSCFVEHIGQRLAQNKFRTTLNPWGTLFNPTSIAQLLQAHESFFLPFYTQNQGVFNNLQTHSSFAALDKNELSDKINLQLKVSQQALHDSDVVVLTWGTAFVHQWKQGDSGEKAIVANCHKLPRACFDKRLLSVEEIVAQYEALNERLLDSKRVILTVSPVRHTRDGVPENQVSKSVLRLAAHELCLRLPNFHYFESYELVLDDLRDYRFYEPDLVHPNSMAVDYVWSKWVEVAFDEPTKSFMQRWQKIRAGIAHRPFLVESEGYQSFVRRLIADLERISEVDCEAELALLRSRLIG
jgi:hypothetical protein